MYFLLAVVAMLAYSIQDIFLTHFSRKLDPLSVGMYRNLSLGISMLPLLFIGGVENIPSVLNVLPTLFVASVCGALTVICFCNANKIFPLGLGAGIRMSVFVLTTLLTGFLFYSELLSLGQVLFVGSLLLGIFILKVQKIDVSHLDKGSVLKGIVLNIIIGVLMTLSFYFMSKAAKVGNPLIVGYFWELSIGICILLFGLLRQLLFKVKIQKIPLKTFGKILLGASPTVIGTGGYAIAITHIPLGIGGAILTANVLVVSLLGYFFFKEKLSSLQFLAMLIIFGSIVGLKLAN